ncbi:COG4648 family protein [Hydrogenophaga aquatica]
MTLRVLRGLGLALLLLAWIVGAHLGSTGRGHPDMNVAVAVAPVVLALAPALAMRGRTWLVAGMLATALALQALWPVLRGNVNLLYYLQHLGIHLALAALFGLSLRGPGDALVTRLARQIMGEHLSVRKVRYTRQVTLAWTVYFLLNALVSTALFTWAPVHVWSLHANVLTGPLVGLMFLLEHLWRKAVLPPEERPSIAAVVRAYQRDRAAHRHAGKQP